MPVPLDCPRLESWPALLDATVPPDQRQRYERHLESCPTYQEHLDRAADGNDPLRLLGRQVGDPTVAPGDAALARVLERLYEVKAPVRTTPLGPPDLDFLQPADRPGVLGTLGAYEVREVIGQGGMGVVLKALDPALDRLVAIKVMTAAVAGSSTARRRFTREARAAAAVRHDHVVAVHGVHDADGLPYLVMQYVAGESLQDRLNRTGPLELKEVVRIGLETASGLAAAHAQGLIHRDIKPANLLLEGGVDKVKITDFGLARTADDVGLTRDGVVAGTPEYMAPEQARGEVIDHRADLFSLGSVLYALCTGVPPFRGSPAVAVLRQVSDEEPASVRSLNPEVPAWLEALLERLLAKEPARRFQSAAEVAAVLEGCLAHLRQPATVPAPDLPPRAGDGPEPLPGFVGRSRSRLWLAVLVSVAALGLGVARWLAGTGGGTVPNKEYKDQYSISLRGTPEKSTRFEFCGPDADECVHFEPAGLRLTLPRGFPGQRTGTGLTIPVAAKGDFEITVGFEVLQEPEPAAAGEQQTLFALDAVLDAPGDTAATIARKVDPRAGTQFLAWLTVWDETAQKNQTRGKGFPTRTKSGRLRLVRSGSALSYFASAAPDGEFVLLDTFPFAAEDLQAVRLLGSTGGPQASLDVRANDLLVRAGSLPDLPETTAATPEQSRGRGWPTTGALLALVILLVGAVLLGAWRSGRQSRRAGTVRPDPALPPGGIGQGEGKDKWAEPATAPPSLAVQCSGCGRKLKAREELAGKRVKCPQCGQAVLVPRTEAGEAGAPA